LNDTLKGEPRTPAARRTLVLGGGISGLAAAKGLQHQRRPYRLLEACPTLGGLTRTVNVGEYCFDYTGHFLHLCRYQTPAGVPFADLADDDWHEVERRSYCYVAGRMIPAPIQYHLGALPPEVLARCVESYDARPPLPAGPGTFRDYIVSGFGEYLAELFLIPQNEKTMAIDLNRLSMGAVKRFFPPPDEKRVRAGIAGATLGANEYNQRFWYPKTGGIERLVHGLSSGLSDAWVNQEVSEIDLNARSVTTKQGERFAWDALLTSIPLKTLCRCTNDPDLVAAAERMSHSTTISYNFGTRGRLPEALRDAHWIYVPDRTLPFYRVGFYSNISRGTCGAGRNSMYVEVGVPGGGAEDLDITGALQRRVIDALARLGWVAARDIECAAIHVIPCAYVHHTTERAQIVADVFERLRAHQIYPIGRYGQWDYTGMEDSIESALRTVKEIS